MRPSRSAGHSRSRRSEPKLRPPRSWPATRIGIETWDFSPMRRQVAISPAASGGSWSRRENTTGCPARPIDRAQGFVWPIFNRGVRSMPGLAHECVTFSCPVTADITLSEQRSMSSVCTIRRSPSSTAPSIRSAPKPTNPADNSANSRSNASSSSEESCMSLTLPSDAGLARSAGKRCRRLRRLLCRATLPMPPTQPARNRPRVRSWPRPSACRVASSRPAAATAGSVAPSLRPVAAPRSAWSLRAGSRGSRTAT